MQFLTIEKDTMLQDLADRVGDRNVDAVLSTNGLQRVPNIGQMLNSMYQAAAGDSSISVNPQKKASILNQLTTDSDIFEYVALSNESSWKVYSQYNGIPGTIRLPETVVLPDADDIMGNEVHIGKDLYEQAMSQLLNPPHYIDPSIFNEYSTIGNIRTLEYRESNASVVDWFNIPWGQITLYSSLSGESIDFPVYPDDVSDSRRATYVTMPDLLYQYEPWYLYDSSGPRTNSYLFDMHRDMWTGDHRDGNANRLIRFCQANCYPRYSGASVNTALVTLYIAGSPLITGIMEDVSVKWDGPIGLDGWYLHFQVEITITEVAQTALNYDTVRNIPLIG